MTRKLTCQYGLWESPITPGILAGDLRLSDVQWDPRGKSLMWMEGRSGVGVLAAQEHEDEAPRDLTSDLNVRAEVGYGGGDFAIYNGQIFFLVHKTGRIYMQALEGGRASPISPSNGKAAAPTLSPDGRWITYVHHDLERVDRIGILDAEGRQWPQIFSAGHDFYMQPCWSPDGQYFAWIAWDHPCMPWDGTSLYLAEVVSAADGLLPSLGKTRVIAGSADEAVFQPEFTADGKYLVYISDKSGWSHLWKYDLNAERHVQLTDGDAEYGVPAWAQGMRTYTLMPSGKTAVSARCQKGFVQVQTTDLATGKSRAVEELQEYTEVSQLCASTDGRRIACIAGSPTIPSRIIIHDFATSRTRVVLRSSGENIPVGSLSRPQALMWNTTGGDRAHGLYYPPASSVYEGTGRPPLVVIVHGGPTGQVRAGWHSQAQFFATRGFGVLTVNYRGSTGYGRDYMLRLRGNWGICDVEDCISGMRYLAEQGRIDSKRTAIMGGSAGGFTVLQSMVTQPDAFAAGVILFGVSNHFHLAAETHKFEERYLDSLIGPLPEAAAIYRERSPVYHAHRIRKPLAIFQGDIDQVVPRNQSDAIVEALKRSGTPHVYHIYKDEGHGWRKRQTIEHFYQSVEEFLRQYLIYR